MSGDPAASGVASVAMGRERVTAGRELAEPDAGLRVRLLDHPVAAAYCLPGVRPRIVLSQGVLDVLTGAELAAVVGHERAHARGQHDLVILPFRAWRQTFPFLPSAGAALVAVELLVELLADDTASRRCGAGPLLAALRRLAGAAPGDVQVAARAARLTTRPARLSRLATAVVYVAAVALVGLPPAILLVS
jgi:Zn-dependent protease with chaperone function